MKRILDYDGEGYWSERTSYAEPCFNIWGVWEAGHEPFWQHLETAVRCAMPDPKSGHGRLHIIVEVEEVDDYTP